MACAGLRTMGRLLAGFGVLALGGGGAAAETVSGTASYRERIALPPEAVFEVVLEDVSRADAPAETLAGARIAGPGNPPIAFRFDYDPATLRPEGRYGLRARVTLEDRLLFTTDRFHPLPGAGASVELPMVMTGAAPGALAAPPEPPESPESPDSPASSESPESPQPPAAARPVAPLGDLPASFRGVLPCADCEGIEYQLDLHGDGVYVLRTTHLGKPESERRFDTLGRWSLAEGRVALVLWRLGEAPEQFELLAEGGLRKLDRQGQRIDSPSNHTLAREPEFLGLEPRLPMQGWYREVDGVGVFGECVSGWRLPVAEEGEHVALARAWRQGVPSLDVARLVSLEGRIAPRPAGRKDGQPMLVVERFDAVWPDLHCPGTLIEAPLAGTLWRLQFIEGGPAEVPPGAPVPTLELDRASSRLAGQGGCNRLMGSYGLEGSALRFGELGSTRMACPWGMELEQAYLDALGGVRGWKRYGTTLELYDDAGRLLLRYQAVAASP